MYALQLEHNNICHVVVYRRIFQLNYYLLYGGSLEMLEKCKLFKNKYAGTRIILFAYCLQSHPLTMVTTHNNIIKMMAEMSSHTSSLLCNAMQHF